MSNEEKKQEILDVIATARTHLKTFEKLKNAVGIDGCHELIERKMFELKQLSLSESIDPKFLAANTSSMSAVKIQETSYPSQSDKKSKSKSPTARQILGDTDKKAFLKLSQMFLKRSDFIFFQQTIRQIGARYRQYDNLKNKTAAVTERYRNGLLLLKEKAERIIEVSVPNANDREFIKANTYSLWVKSTNFSLNNFDEIFK